MKKEKTAILRIKKNDIEIVRGLKKSRYNTRTIEYPTKMFIEETIAFIKTPSFKTLHRLMNTVSTGMCDFAESVYITYFFIMQLVWCVEENRRFIIKKPKTKQKKVK